MSGRKSLQHYYYSHLGIKNCSNLLKDAAPGLEPTFEEPVCVESVCGNECTPTILVYVRLIMQGQSESLHSVSHTSSYTI